MQETITPTASYTLQQLAERIEGASVVGNQSLLVRDLCHPKLVRHATDMAYIASESAWEILRQGVTLGLVEQTLGVPADIQHRIQDGEVALLRVPRGRVALAVLLSLFERRSILEEGIHPSAVIHPTAELGEGVCIGACVTVGENSHIEDGVQIYPNASVGANVRVGADSILYSGSRIGDRCQLGKRCIIQPNAVIGGDGFSYVTPKEARHEKKENSETHQVDSILRINSVGNVVLEDEVEVGACSCIDRGTLAETRIAKGTKIDNLVQIGHNNRIGQNGLIVSQVGIAGSCQIGNGVVIAGQVGIGDHLKIEDDVIIMACSSVMRDIKAGSTVLGSPAIPHKEAMANIAASLKIRDLVKELKAMKGKLKAFEEKAELLEQFLNTNQN